MSKKMMVPAVLKSEDQAINIDESPFNIGSFKDFCQMTIDGDDIAPIHCCIVFDQGEWQIIDQKGLGGVTVNGERMEPGSTQTLQNGDQIEIGSKGFVFSSMPTLFSQDEIKELEDDYHTMIVSEDLEKAKDIVARLWQKIEMVNRISDGASQEEPNSGSDDITPAQTNEAAQSRRTGEFEGFEAEESDFNASEDKAVAADGEFENRGNPIENAENEVKQGSILASRRVRAVDPDEYNIENEEQNGFDTLPICIFNSNDPAIPSFEIQKTPFSIGRSSSCDQTLKYRGMSRKHATVLRDDSNQYLLIRDEGSTNGTFVNDRKLEAHTEMRIQTGDRVRFYKTAFTVQLTQD